MTLAAVRTALANAAKTIEGIDRSSAYATDTISPVLAMVTRDETDYRQVFDATAMKHTLKIVVWCARTSPERADALFDALAAPSGSTSLKATIEANAGVQAACDYAEVLSATGPKTAVDVGGIPYLVCEFPIEVVVS